MNNGKQQFISSFSSESGIGRVRSIALVMILAESIILFCYLSFFTSISHGFVSKPTVRLILSEIPGNAKASNKSN